MSAGRLFASVAEAADRLGISRDLAYDLIHRGELPANRFGRRLVVPLRAIDRIEEAAVAGFDPASTLATAAGASTSPPDVGTPPTATGPEPDPTLRPSGAPRGAPVAVS